MPYQSSRNSALPPERGSRTNHISILDSPFIRQLSLAFAPDINTSKDAKTGWQSIPKSGRPLDHVCVVDGSMLETTLYGGAKAAFISTASIEIPFVASEPFSIHPQEMRDALEELTDKVSTLVPLERITYRDITDRAYEATTNTVFVTLYEHSDLLDTLHWLGMEAWSQRPVRHRNFSCPLCMERVSWDMSITLALCPQCDREINIADWLGLHTILLTDSKKRNFATSFMSVLETLQLFTRIREMWQHDPERIWSTLFVKDGGLGIYGGQKILSGPIRRFLRHAAKSGYPIALLGQEKTGASVAHLHQLRSYLTLDDDTMMIPDAEYVSEKIFGRKHGLTEHFGQDHLYGSRILLNYDMHRSMVISIASSDIMPVPTTADMYRVKDILATLPTLFGRSHENALWPIEMAHEACSLGHFPATDVLSQFLSEQWSK